jgi:hypothetical protein
MKRAVFSTFLALVAGAVIPILSGCTSTSQIKQLSGHEFLKRAQDCDVKGTAVLTIFTGCTSENAYLKSECPSLLGKGTSTIVYWTPLSELSRDLVEELKAGKPSWASWTDNHRPSAHSGKSSQNAQLPEDNRPRL